MILPEVALSRRPEDAQSQSADCCLVVVTVSYHTRHDCLCVGPKASQGFNAGGSSESSCCSQCPWVILDVPVGNR